MFPENFPNHSILNHTHTETTWKLGTKYSGTNRTTTLGLLRFIRNLTRLIFQIGLKNGGATSA